MSFAPEERNVYRIMIPTTSALQKSVMRVALGLADQHSPAGGTDNNLNHHPILTLNLPHQTTQQQNFHFSTVRNSSSLNKKSVDC